MYTVLIDEAGDTGLKNVTADPSYGPTQYFTLCATIFREENRSFLEGALVSLPYNRGDLHANKLNHFEKVHLCRTISNLPVGMLGIISNKLTLLDYLSSAQKTPTHYYNKCMQYLLEMIGICILAMSIDKKGVKIFLEAREQRYSSLLSFVQAIQRNPLHKRARAMQSLNAFSISNAKKLDDPCFAIADMGANALFNAVRRDARAFGLAEARYLNELAPVFLASENGRIVPDGIKPIHSTADLALPSDAEAALESLVNPNNDYRRL